MCAVTHRAKPYQLTLLIKKSLDDVIGTQQSAREATLQYQYENSYFPLMLYLRKVLLIHLQKVVFYIIYKLKLPLHASFKKTRGPVGFRGPHPSRGGDILVHGLSPAPGPQTGTPPRLNNNHRPETAPMFTALVPLLWHAFLDNIRLLNIANYLDRFQRVMVRTSKRGK